MKILFIKILVLFGILALETTNTGMIQKEATTQKTTKNSISVQGMTTQEARTHKRTTQKATTQEVTSGRETTKDIGTKNLITDGTTSKDDTTTEGIEKIKAMLFCDYELFNICLIKKAMLSRID